MSTLTKPSVSAGDETVSHERLQLQPQVFAESFSKQPFLIGHSLTDHPLFQLPRLLELSRALAEHDIEYSAGQLPVNQDPLRTPRNGLSPEETIHRIEHCQSWMVLKNVQQDPAYGELLQECLSQMRPLTEPIVPGMTKPQAFIFLSSPGSTTPYHIDPEHNFLLQVRGHKTIRMWDGRQSDLLSHEELEHFYGARSRHLVLKPENEAKCWTFELQPGYGLHFPVTYPHWVKNGDAVSISFSITFRTPDLDRRRSVYEWNHWLRSKGLRPTPYQTRPRLDFLKHQASRVMGRIFR